MINMTKVHVLWKVKITSIKNGKLGLTLGKTPIFRRIEEEKVSGAHILGNGVIFQCYFIFPVPRLNPSPQKNIVFKVRNFKRRDHI